LKVKAFFALKIDVRELRFYLYFKMMFESQGLKVETFFVFFN